MSNILKFVFDNFSQLKPFDYILIILIVGMGLLIISIVARRIYRALIDAQASLIKVKDETIAEYKSTTDRLRSEKSELIASLDQTEIRLHGLHEKFAALQNKHAELRGFLEEILVGITTLWKTTLITTMAIKRLEIIGCNRRMVHLYGSLREAIEGDSPEPIALLMRLDEVEQIVVNRLNALEEIVPSTPGEIVLPSSVPSRFAELVQDDDIKTSLEVFGGELDRLLEPVIAKYEAESK